MNDEFCPRCATKAIAGYQEQAKGFRQAMVAFERRNSALAREIQGLQERNTRQIAKAFMWGSFLTGLAIALVLGFERLI